MITEDDVRTAIKAAGDFPRFHELAFEHPDVLVRAGYQATWLKQAAGVTGEIILTDTEVRSTPAGRTIPADEPALLSERPCPIHGRSCSPRPAGDVR
jgi:hypothetical protein